MSLQELPISGSEPVAETSTVLPPVDAQLDLRGTPCPINFVRTKLKIDQMAPGSVLEVWLDAGEPIEQVPDSLTMEGHQVLQIQPRSEFFAVTVRKSAAA